MAETTNTVGYQAMEVLYNTEDKITPTEIGAKIGIEGFQVGRQLKDKVQQRLVNKSVEGKTSYYQITENGRQWVEAEHERIESIAREQKKPPAASPAAGAPAAAPAAKVEAVLEPSEGTETVPSQSDSFRSIGEKLGVGKGKGEVRLDAIIYYVQRTPDLDNLSLITLPPAVTLGDLFFAIQHPSGNPSPD